MAEQSYVWFRTIAGDELEQGDILEKCPVFSPPESLLPQAPFVEFEEKTYNVIIVSQSCDIARRDDALSQVLLCPVWTIDELMPGRGKNAKRDELEDLRKGKRPALHLLNRCDLPDFSRDFRVVDFRRVYSLPIGYVRAVARGYSTRLRLCPPYREHLSQSLARYFMRVGLPVDIPTFKK